MDTKIYNKIQDIIREKVNDDFDFGSLDIDNSAADTYKATGSVIRETANMNVDMQKVFLDKFGRRIPSGFTAVDTLEGIGRVWHRGKAWEVVTQKRWRCTANDMVSKADNRWLDNSENGWECQYVNDAEMHKPNCPEYIKAAVKALGWDPDKLDFSIRTDYWLSPDKGVCVIDRLRLCVIRGAQTPLVNGRSSITIPSMIFYTGDVIYNPDNSASKAKEKEIKLLNKTQKFFDNINLPPKNQLEWSNRYIPEIAPNGEPIWVYHYEKWPLIYLTLKGSDVPDIDFYALDPKNRYGLITSFQYYYNPDKPELSAYQIDPDSWADAASNTIDFHAVSDVFDFHLMSDERYLKRVIGQKALDKATKMRVTLYNQPADILYSGVMFLTLTPKFLKVYKDFMSNKIKQRDLYLHRYEV